MAACVGLRDISNECQLCGEMNNLMLCGGCKRAWYCSREHQKYDWKRHKKKCKKHRQQTNDVAESGQVAINSNRMSITGSPPRGNGIRDSEDVYPKVVDDDKNMNQSKTTDLTLAAGNVSKLEGLKLDEVKNDMSYNALEESHSKLAKEYFIQSGISELKPYTSESLMKNIALHSSDCSKNKMPPTTEEQYDTSKTYFSVLEHRNRMLADYACNCLNRYGVCVIDNFLGSSKGLEILDQVRDMHSSGIFKKGQLMSASGTSNLNHVRGDVLTWVEGSEDGCEDIGFLISSMDAVVLKCGGNLKHCNINGRTKAMVACYPGGGTQYLRHVDNPNDDGRCITCIYYLNKDWDAKKYGGLLRIYPEGEDKVASVEPVFDRLLFFWSDRRNPHEVMKAYKTRYAITVWYYDTDQREMAVKKYKGAAKSEIVPLTTKKFTTADRK